MRQGDVYYFWTRDGNEVPALEKTTIANYPNQVWEPMGDSDFDSYTIGEWMRLFSGLKTALLEAFHQN